ncbi:MAG TPA: hypothetical protein VGR21_10710, partial [Cryptosporangiaceae bacterium]|nr:hypothetical protein [Cryptosporangiaceae bacterium]
VAPGAVWRVGAARRCSGTVRAASIVTLVVVAGVAGVGWAASGAPEFAGPVVVGGSPSTTAPAVVAPAAAVPRTDREWRVVVEELDARRGEALARARAELLDRVYVPGSASLAADTQAIRSLVAVGATAPGVRHQVTAVRVLSVGAARARLVVTDRMPAYRIVARSGVVLREVPARPAKAFEVELVSGVQGWRIQSIAPAR